MCCSHSHILDGDRWVTVHSNGALTWRLTTCSHFLCWWWHISWWGLSLIKSGTYSIRCSAALLPFDCHFNCFSSSYSHHTWLLHTINFFSSKGKVSSYKHANMVLIKKIECFENVGPQILYVHTLIWKLMQVDVDSCMLMSWWLAIKWLMCVFCTCGTELWSVRFPQIAPLICRLSVVSAVFVSPQWQQLQLNTWPSLQSYIEGATHT